MVACTLIWYTKIESLWVTCVEFQKREVFRTMFGMGVTATQMLNGIIVTFLLIWLSFCTVVTLNVSRRRKAAQATTPVELPAVAMSMAMARHPEE